MITFACVRIGTKYGPEYVARLRNMIGRHFAGPKRFICLTDQADRVEDVEHIDVTERHLEKWWPKMLLFSPEYRGDRTVYLDLDTVIVGDLTPLVEWNGAFGICENFARLAGAPYKCLYGSCCMVFSPGWGQHIFDEFWANRKALMLDAIRFGDQMVIEELVPRATLLQQELPPGFFLNKRDLAKYPDAPPPGAAVVVFGGNDRPHNCDIPWVRAAWH